MVSLKEEIIEILDKHLSLFISLHTINGQCYDTSSIAGKEQAAAEIVRFLNSKSLSPLGYNNFSAMLDELAALPDCAGDCGSIGSRLERGCDDCDMIKEK